MVETLLTLVVGNPLIDTKHQVYSFDSGLVNVFLTVGPTLVTPPIRHRRAPVGTSKLGK